MKQLFVITALMFALAFGVFSTPAAEAAPAKNVILVHGWNDGPSTFNTMKADLEAQGFAVHALKLPRSGSRSGDTVTNAKFIQSYVQTNQLTGVVIVGHSLGGTLVEYYVRVLDRGEIVGRATLDSNIQQPTGDRGFYCWFVPDQCEGSAVRRAIFAADPRADIPFLNVANSSAAMSVVDCNLTVSGGHTSYPSLAQVRAAVVTLSKGLSPC